MNVKQQTNTPICNIIQAERDSLMSNSKQILLFAILSRQEEVNEGQTANKYSYLQYYPDRKRLMNVKQQTNTPICNIIQAGRG